uniref:Tetratricopeptide repeat protein 7 N-terminal domain-containing protein n=1 Tax=Denticeps clupeoides TaxID=299321 RepID=A0AAY4B4C8_9TELE
GKMTARKSGSRLETEIERCRSEAEWSEWWGLFAVVWLVSSVDCAVCVCVCVDDLGELLLGEAKLQQYLKENPIKQGASPRGNRPRLVEVRKHLTAALDRGNLKPDYMQEASLLMAKLSYVEGDHREALSQYSRVNLDQLQLVGTPVYRLSMIAEAYATKGLCLEKIPFGSPALSNRSVDRDQEIITCYEKSGDIALIYLQEAEKVGLVCSLQFLSWMYLSGLTGEGSAILTLLSCSSLFCPQENTEEALLLLLISESMANRDAVLSRIPEHNNDRIISLQSASVVYDLLTIALGRRGQYEMLSECLERAMKFAFEEFHLWYQLALSLMAAGKSARAVKVLKECIRLKPDDPTIPLLAVKLCIGNLHWLEEGERFAQMVLDMGEKAAEFRAKGYLAVGLVYSLRATDASLRGMQEEYQKKALGAFQRAQSLSPTDHLAAFYLALQLAVSRQIPEALGYVRQALQLQGDDVHCLHLLALLLSAQKHYHDALNIVEMALSEYPENFVLLFTKVKLETLCRGPEEALLTCKHMLPAILYATPPDRRYCTATPPDRRYCTATPPDRRYCTATPPDRRYCTAITHPTADTVPRHHPDRRYCTATPPDRRYCTATPPDRRYCTAITPDRRYCTATPPDRRYCTATPPDRRYCTAITPDRRYCTAITPDRRYCTAITPDRRYCTAITPDRRYCTAITPSTARYCTAITSRPPDTVPRSHPDADTAPRHHPDRRYCTAITHPTADTVPRSHTRPPILHRDHTRPPILHRDHTRPPILYRDHTPDRRYCTATPPDRRYCTATPPDRRYCTATPPDRRYCTAITHPTGDTVPRHHPTADTVPRSHPTADTVGCRLESQSAAE